MITLARVTIKETGKCLSGVIPDGIVYLSGENGSGKTLLLDMLSGLRQLPEGAKIEYHGLQSIYMRQNFLFNFKLTVKEYLTFIMGLNEMTMTDFEQFIQTYYVQYDVTKLLKKRLGVLSGGERQLIYLLSVLCIKRDLYLLDEPFASIDAKKATELFNVIAQMHQREGKQFVITSHIPLNLEGVMTVEMNTLDVSTVLL